MEKVIYLMSNEENKYINFFENIKKFKIKQKQQKQRGLNDYNMVNVVRKENAEVGMHSNVIYSLIDPDGLHYQDDLFLQIFISDVLEISDFGEILSVNAEESTHEQRRVDFTIKSTKYYIGIEMKIDAGDLENQISHYFEDLSIKALNDNKQEVIIYYLTKDGKAASKYSAKIIDYKKVSFDNHILNWINKCQHEVKNITNLNEAFENYKDIVNKILNNYEGKVMQLKDLLKSQENYSIAKDIYEAYLDTSAELEKNFWETAYKKLIDNDIKVLAHSIFDVDTIKKARNANGSSSEVWIDFDIYEIDQNNKVILKVGSSNWSDGVFITIAKLQNGTWVSGNNNHEKYIINKINSLDNLNFTKPNWAYGLSEFKEYQLRNEKLPITIENVNDFVYQLELLINKLKIILIENDES